MSTKSKLVEAIEVLRERRRVLEREMGDRGARLEELDGAIKTLERLHAKRRAKKVEPVAVAAQ